MKIIYNKVIPFKGYLAINLFGLLFVRKKDDGSKPRLSPQTINHEKIHTAQMREMLYIFFYLWYLVEYIIVRLFHKKQSSAYHDISFEEEAYTYQYDYSYLKNRKHYAWFKFLKVKSYKD